MQVNVEWLVDGDVITPALTFAFGGFPVPLSFLLLGAARGVFVLVSLFESLSDVCVHAR